MTDSKQLGNRGEDLAVLYLVELGFVILCRNWRAGRGLSSHGEIDIVAQKDDVLHFVEVKTRANGSTNGDFAPESAFTEVKKERLYQTIEHYIAQNNYQGEVSLDLIAINFTHDTHSLRYYPHCI